MEVSKMDSVMNNFLAEFFGIFFEGAEVTEDMKKILSPIFKTAIVEGYKEFNWKVEESDDKFPVKDYIRMGFICSLVILFSHLQLSGHNDLVIKLLSVLGVKEDELQVKSH